MKEEELHLPVIQNQNSPKKAFKFNNILDKVRVRLQNKGDTINSNNIDDTKDSPKKLNASSTKPESFRLPIIKKPSQTTTNSPRGSTDDLF